MGESLASSFDSLDVNKSDTGLDLALVLSQLESIDQDSATAVAEELTSLAAIYDNPAPSLSLYRPAATSRIRSPPAIWDPSTSSSSSPLRLVLSTTLAPPFEESPLHLLLSIPYPKYPSEEPPLIQLQDRYLSNFAVDDELFAQVLRTFMHDSDANLVVAGTTNGVEWTPGGVCLFEGIEYVKEVCSKWVEERAEEKKRGEEARNATMASPDGTNGSIDQPVDDGVKEGIEGERVRKGEETTKSNRKGVECPEIISGEPLVDRKSVFVGHVAKVTSMEEVEAVMSELLSNNRIAKATHNISAYQFVSNEGVRFSDNDDDGESAAGGRLAHLLELVDAHNVIVVVSRFYGGIHLGPDRFKDINQAARDALIAGGFLAEQEQKTKGTKGGKGGGSNTKKR